MFTHISIAAAVAALREFDARDGTDRAITEVAETLHLDATEVGEIARDLSHEEALFEDRKRELAAVAARSLDIAPEVAEASCRSCGACTRQSVEA
jgi:hypothetical protein